MPSEPCAAGKFFTNWPPIPELPLIWMVFYMTFWVVISPDVSEPDVKTLVRKYVSEALGWTIHDPVCRIREDSVLKEYYFFRSSYFSFLSSSGNPLHGKNEAIFCCHVMLFIRVSSASDDLSLIIEEEHMWVNCTFFIELSRRLTTYNPSSFQLFDLWKETQWEGDYGALFVSFKN